MTEREGVIKYRLEHRPAPPPAPALVRSLAAWRLILRALGLVGQHPERYDCLGFGNLSRRIDAGCDSTPAFVITGTQTGYLTDTAPEHYCLVRRYDLGANHILAEGPVAPSSEALTHAAIYAAAADIRYVFHAHHPDIWRRASALGLPGTPVDVAYGTPAMAEAVGALLARHTTAPAGVFYMAGHEDGIVAWGETAEAAGCALVSTMAGALQR